MSGNLYNSHRSRYATRPRTGYARAMKKLPPKWPRWIDSSDNVNLREVAPNLYVGAEYSPLHPPAGKKWELVIDWYGSSERWPSRTRDTAKRVLSIPFLDGDVFPPKALDTMLARVQAARHRGPTLIHCQAGLSRSASAAYGFLRRVGRLPHKEALRRVQADPEFPRATTLASARVWAERKAQHAM